MSSVETTTRGPRPRGPAGGRRCSSCGRRSASAAARPRRTTTRSSPTPSTWSPPTWPRPIRSYDEVTDGRDRHGTQSHIQIHTVRSFCPPS
uniref:Uncharacterized protein n=1 Tax=Arundo donax TaxID=35708 RepID=A0A0A9D9Z8_ARUDO